MNRVIPHFASVSSTFNSYKLFRKHQMLRLLLTTVFLLYLEVCCFTGKNHMWHLSLFAVVIVPFFSGRTLQGQQILTQSPAVK